GPASQLFIDSPVVGYYLNFVTFFLFPIPLYIFTELIIGRGYKSLIRRIWQVHIPVAIAAFLLDVTNIFPMLYAMLFLFGLLTIGIFITLPIAIVAAYKGNFEARMLVIGMAIFMLSGMHDMLISFGVVPNWRWLFSWGVFIFILFLAYILERRFAQAHQQLEEHSRTLEQKVEDRTQELSRKNVALEQAFQKLRDTQTQLVIQSKMASLGNLVAGVAHEMNNPIGVIHSAADTASRGVQKIADILQSDEALKESHRSEDRLQQSVELVERNHRIITTASERIAGTVQNLKTFATLDEALFQKVDIHENIDTTLSLLYHELRDNVIVIKEYGDIPRIQCYPNELNQAFMNLFRNAIQAFPSSAGRTDSEHGEAINQRGTITVTTYTDGGQVYIKISDTGEGIPPEARSRVFDPGFTTRGGGVGKGLGLSIVYNIIQKHHGTIEVDSEVGAGTAITIALPIEQPRDN
ncbi:sensor histidine kinase, partial [Candidatus Poribacteria bacterium]